VRDVVILDGGMSRELEACGAQLRQPEWSAAALWEHPEAVYQAHLNFVKSGAQVIITNSYALVPFHLGPKRFRDQAESLAAVSGELARKAAEIIPGVRVAGGIPPLFGSYRPDLFDAAQAADILAPLVRGLSAHVDFWLVETISSLEEARVVHDLLAPAGKAIQLSFTILDQAGDMPLLRSGEPVAAAAALAADLGVEAILFNCSAPEVMRAAVKVTKDVLSQRQVDMPIGVYANAFTVDSPEKVRAANETLSQIRTELTPERYATLAQGWVAAGAGIVGGCCGIGPAHIAALRDMFAS